MKDGRHSIELLFSALKDCNKHMNNGAVLTHCRNGANRATLFGVCMVTAKTGCSVGAALSHVYCLRGLTDICEVGPDDNWSHYPCPLTWLEGIEGDLQRLCINMGNKKGWVDWLAILIKYLVVRRCTAYMNAYTI